MSEIRVSEFSKSREAFEADRYFPPILKELFTDALPAYEGCPGTIDCTGTPFEATLKEFSQEVNRKTIATPKQIKSREIRKVAWDIECCLSIYNIDGSVVDSRPPRSSIEKRADITVILGLENYKKIF